MQALFPIYLLFFFSGITVVTGPLSPWKVYVLVGRVVYTYFILGKKNSKPFVPILFNPLEKSQATLDGTLSLHCQHHGRNGENALD